MSDVIDKLSMLTEIAIGSPIRRESGVEGVATLAYRDGGPAIVVEAGLNAADELRAIAEQIVRFGACDDPHAPLSPELERKTKALAEGLAILSGQDPPPAARRRTSHKPPAPAGAGKRSGCYRKTGTR